MMVDLVEKLAAGDDRLWQRREEVDRVLGRLDLLEGEERVLLEMRYRHGVTFVQLALLTGQSRMTITARIMGLTQRLMGREYIAISGHSDQFSGEEVQVAYDHYLLGLGYRRIAAKRDLRPFRVRRIVERLREWIERNEG